ncbi:MAG: glycosyltransferase family 2 protein [Methylophilaceae bacterium]|jgi:glycosyltransferase involved in cell wall biosynthesis
MLSSAPLITVGVTCYNASDTIARAIASAAGQDWPNLEIVVVDDGSADNSLEVIKALALSDSRIRLIPHGNNRGCAAARNTIIKEAKGAFLAFFDDDDASHPERVRRQYEYITSYEQATNAQLVACYASGVRHYPNGYQMPLQAIGSEPGIPVGRVLVDYLLAFVRPHGIFFGTGTPTCSLMARRETFQAVGDFDIAMRRQEDADFAVRLGMLGGHFIGTREPLFFQYASAGSDKNAKAEHDSLTHLLHKNREYLDERGLYRYMLGWAEIRYSHFNHEPMKALVALLKLALRFPVRTSRHFAVSAIRRYRHERKIYSND